MLWKQQFPDFIFIFHYLFFCGAFVAVRRRSRHRQSCASHRRKLGSVWLHHILNTLPRPHINHTHSKTYGTIVLQKSIHWLIYKKNLLLLLSLSAFQTALGWVDCHDVSIFTGMLLIFFHLPASKEKAPDLFQFRLWGKRKQKFLL